MKRIICTPEGNTPKELGNMSINRYDVKDENDEVIFTRRAVGNYRSSGLSSLQACVAFCKENNFEYQFGGEE